MSSEERELCCSLSTFLRDHFRYGTHATRYNASYGKAVGRSRHGRNKDHVWMATELQNITISLPNNKTITWADKIASMLEEGNTKAKRLERCIGRFVNIGMILLYAHHFLAGMQTSLKKAKKRQSAIEIPAQVKKDLVLMDNVITQANKGVDMNNLARRLLTVTFKNNSCPFGHGGYSVVGNRWRWRIPPDLRFRATNNLLKHLANLASKK